VGTPASRRTVPQLHVGILSKGCQTSFASISSDAKHDALGDSSCRSISSRHFLVCLDRETQAPFLLLCEVQFVQSDPLADIKEMGGIPLVSLGSKLRRKDIAPQPEPKTTMRVRGKPLGV